LGFRRLGEEVRFTGTLVTVATGTFEAPDGHTFERDVVHHPGAVVVVPVVEGADGRHHAVLVRQYRAAVDAELLEVPAGKRDVHGEPVETTAHRELEEEVGMKAGRLTKLAEFYNSPGFTDEHTYLFMATELTDCATSAQGVEEMHMTVERVALDDVAQLVASGGLVDAKSIIGLCLAAQAVSGWR
jgi:ADP-ribose pyrophosphatase